MANQPWSESDRRWLDNHVKLVEAVTPEIESDFSRLNGLATLGLWSEVEHFCKKLISLHVLNKPEILQSREFTKIKIRVSDLVNLSKEEQAWLITESIEKDLSGPPRRGIEKFEALLQLIKLDGKLDQKVNKTFREFHQIRNIYAHTHGFADRRFTSEMPEFKEHIGQKINVSQQMIDKFFSISFEYINVVEARIIGGGK